MKIGTTTFTWVENYGAALQAHALQRFLQDRGHDVHIINFRISFEPTGIRRWLGRNLTACEKKWKTYLFDRFRRMHMTFTPETFRSAEDLSAIKDRFELLITGSDQVWNPKWLAQFEGLFELCFLSFGGAKTRRISYAASIGHSDLRTIKDEWQELMAERLKAIHAISVREKSGVTLIEQLAHRSDAVHVVDPTLLLERSHYDALAGRTRKAKQAVFSYMLHGMENDAEPAIRAIRRILKLKAVKCDGLRTALHPGYTLPSPSGWLRQIRDSEFVVTNSFHAVIFCIIFHRPFIALMIEGENGSMNSRILEILGSVGLANRVFSPGTGVTKPFLDQTIDWKEVDRRICQLKESGINFLSGRLSAQVEGN
jgi:hypothetical protein